MNFCKISNGRFSVAGKVHLMLSVLLIFFPSSQKTKTCRQCSPAVSSNQQASHAFDIGSVRLTVHDKVLSSLFNICTISPLQFIGNRLLNLTAVPRIFWLQAFYLCWCHPTTVSVLLLHSRNLKWTPPQHHRSRKSFPKKMSKSFWPILYFRGCCPYMRHRTWYLSSASAGKL